MQFYFNFIWKFGRFPSSASTMNNCTKNTAPTETLKND